MYHETIDERKCMVTLVCDRKNCNAPVTVERESHDLCQRTLLLIGWRLYRGKQLCPKHAALVFKRLTKESNI